MGRKHHTQDLSRERTECSRDRAPEIVNRWQLHRVLWFLLSVRWYESFAPDASTSFEREPDMTPFLGGRTVAKKKKKAAQKRKKAAKKKKKAAPKRKKAAKKKKAAK